MNFTPEQIFAVVMAVIVPVGVIMKAWGGSIEKRWVIRVKQIEGDNAARIKELEGDADMRDMLRDQIKVNDQLRETQDTQFKRYMRALKQQREDANAGYRTIRDVQNDEVTVLANLINEVKALARVTQDNAATVATIVTEAAAMHRDTRAFFKEQMQLTARHFEEQQANNRALSIMSADFQFPADDDCRWTVARVKSKTSSHKATIWAIPRMMDKNAVGEIQNGTGELVRIIQYTAWHGWHAVRKIDDPDQHGWIDAQLVEVMDANTPVPITPPPPHTVPISPPQS